MNSTSKYFLDTFDEFSLVFEISDNFAPGNTKLSKESNFL